MGAKSAKLGRLRAKAYSLPNVTTAAATTDLGSGTVHEIRANQMPEFSLMIQNLADGRMVQWLHDKPPPKLGLRTWKLTFETYLHSHGQTTGTSTVYDQDTDHLGFLLAKGLGAQSIAATGANTDVASGSAATGFVTTTGHGGRLLGGMACAINPNGLGYYEARPIKRAGNSDTVTVKTVFSQAMTTGDDVIGGQTTYCPQSSPLTQGVHFLGYGHDSNDQYVMANGKCTGFSLKLGTGGLDTISWTWEGVGWDVTSGNAWGSATYNGAACKVAKDSELLISSIAGTTRVVHHAPEYGINISLTRVGYGSPSGIEGEFNHVHLGCDVTANWTLKFDAELGTPYDLTYKTGREAGTKYQMQLQRGRSTPGEILLIEVPTLHIMDWKRRALAGIQMHQTDAEAEIDAAITAASDDDLECANLRIHRL